MALEALTACADISLVPRLREALDGFVDDRNFYGRDLMARVLVGIQGVAALPALLRASAFGKINGMFPLVSGVQELRQVKTLVREIRT